MRSLEECQAEVFRRSKTRIKERRRRSSRLLAVCVPLVLCAAVLSVVLLPDANTPDPAAPESAMGQLTGQTEYSYICPVREITVSVAGDSKTHRNSGEILPVVRQLNDCVSSQSEYHGESQKNSADGKESVADTVDTDYTVTLTMHDGTQTVYYFKGSTLTDLTKDEKYFLSEEQAHSLRKLLEGL